ncbi:cytochrome bd-I oxidase subunit CydX [Arhodomonas sp. AD133]|uniref:cytochrome bd-I oxidase subunit CydX n=1 Tax=Arhodomonas sp. AD133 TaxID=3415009 RepID=UPI003EBE39E1
MWYFTWILGVLFACAFGIINAMWIEHHLTNGEGGGEPNDEGAPGGDSQPPR